MSGLKLRRLIVVIISQVLGFLVSLAIIGPGFDALPILRYVPELPLVGRIVGSIQTPQGRDIATYGWQYFFWTFFPIGIVFMIWIDKFADTKILPE